MLFLILVTIVLLGVMYGRISKNNDLITKNNKTVVDTANVNNAKKFYHNNKTATITLLVGIALVFFCVLCEFTDIETKFIDYFSTDFIDTVELDRKLYFLPIYFLITREIYIQVKISEYLQKFYDDKEIEEKIDLKKLKEIDIKKILYKKPAKPAEEDPNKVIRTNEINEILDVEDNQNK